MGFLGIYFENLNLGQRVLRVEWPPNTISLLGQFSQKKKRISKRKAIKDISAINMHFVKKKEKNKIMIYKSFFAGNEMINLPISFPCFI
jgi:hypothetical protein